MPSGLRVLSLRNVLSLLTIACLAYACGSDHNPMAPSMPEVAAPAAADSNGSVKAMSDDDYDRECHVRILQKNFSEGGLLPSDNILRIQLDVSGTTCEWIHLSAWFQGDFPQDPIASNPKRISPEMGTTWIELNLNNGKLYKNCGISVQVDLAPDKNPAPGAMYTYTIADWRLGNPCGGVHETPTPETTPQPTPTPTPHCNVETLGVHSFAASTCDPTPTPTPSPTATPTPPPTCELPAADDLICHSVFGSPENECGNFGLSALGKDDDLDGSSHVASMNAALAIVKDGSKGCSHGQTAYRTYTNVSAGDTLYKPTGAGDISHVTYCGCPVD